MPANLLIYPLDYPATIVGPSELELRVIELEAKMESVAIGGLQDRRNAGDDAIDLELKNTSISVYHSPIPRFGFRESDRGTKGFLMGGETSDSLTARIARFDYLFETVSLIGADLGIARHSGTGTSAVAAGYIGGGNTSSSITSKIEKLSFDTETVTLLAQQLTVPTSEMAGFATTSASFYLGGFSGATNSIVSELKSLNHATENTSLLGTALTAPRSNMAIVGTTSQGFVVGGKTAIGTTSYATSIDKITWLTQAVAAAGFSLGSPGAAFNVGLGNDFNGYVVGGKAGTINTARIDRIAHSTESISPVGISVATPVSDAAAAGTAKRGYIMSGGVDPTGEFRSVGAVATTQRLTYVGADNPIERIEPLSFSLPFAATGSSAVSDYSAGTYSSISVSIVNLYDGIYSKLGHVHDDRYPLIEQIYYRADLRRKLDADMTFFVDSLNTVPAAVGLGTSTNPFATIRAAVDWAAGFDYNSHSVKIKVADGTYRESVAFDSTEWVGLRSRGKGAGIILEGNLANPAAVTIISSATTSEVNIRVDGGIDVWVRGIRLQSTYPSSFNLGFGDSHTIATGLSAYNSAVITYSDIIFGSGFDYQLLARLGAFLTIAGNVYVEASCKVHVHIASGSSWSVNAADQRYAQFPAGIGIQGGNIVFAAGLTMLYVFEANSNGFISFDEDITFTGSNIVTGISLVLKAGGQAYSSVPGDIDNPIKFAFIPATVSYVNENIELRQSGNQYVTGTKQFERPLKVPFGSFLNDTVNLEQMNLAIADSTGGLAGQNVKLFGDQIVDGVKNFSRNIRVPNGTRANDAVNLSQLNSVQNQYGTDRIVFPNGLKINFGTIFLSGVQWTSGGNIISDQRGFGVNFTVGFVNTPSVTLTLANTIRTGDWGAGINLNIFNLSNTRFEWYGDAINGSFIGDGQISWMAIGY